MQGGLGHGAAKHLQCHTSSEQRCHLISLRRDIQLASFVQVSVTERQLVAELLALYTPEAVAEQSRLPKARRAAGLAAEKVLLDVLGLEPSPGQAAAQSPIRLVALTQLTGLYTSLTLGHQQQLIQVQLPFPLQRKCGCEYCSGCLQAGCHLPSIPWGS